MREKCHILLLYQYLLTLTLSIDYTYISWFISGFFVVTCLINYLQDETWDKIKNINSYLLIFINLLIEFIRDSTFCEL